MRKMSAGSELPAGGGVILVDKAQGSTSHDVVLALRRLLRIAGIGHTGTLDPMATGLLVLCTGTATKLSPYLSGQEKEYLGTATFGAVTDSLDATGKVIDRKPVEGCVDARKLRRAMASLTGELQQVPPMASAVKMNGVRLHRLARRGVEVQRRARPVNVRVFELIRCGGDTAEFRVVCSSGTYVRCLAAELGDALGCGAHLSRLRRTRVGRFSVDGVLTVHEALRIGAEAVLANHLIPAAQALDFLPFVVLDHAGIGAVRHGRPAPAASVLDWDPDLVRRPGAIRVIDENGILRAIGAADLAEGGKPGEIRPLRVLGSPSSGPRE